MIIMGSIFLSVAIVLSLLGTAGVYYDVSSMFDGIMKVVVITLGIAGIVLLVANIVVTASAT